MSTLRLFRRLKTFFERTVGGFSPAASPGRSGIHIDISNSAIRGEANIARLGAELGFELRSRG